MNHWEQYISLLVALVNKFQRSKLKKIRFANSVMKSFCSVQSVDLINVVSVRGHKSEHEYNYCPDCTKQLDIKDPS